MENINNLFEDKNNNGIPDLFETNNSSGISFSSVNFVIDGKNYKSLEEMPPEVRQKAEEKMKMLKDIPFNKDSFTTNSSRTNSFFSQKYTTGDNSANPADKNMGTLPSYLYTSQIYNSSSSAVSPTAMAIIIALTFVTVGGLQYLSWKILPSNDPNLVAASAEFFTFSMGIGFLIMAIGLFIAQRSFIKQAALAKGKVFYVIKSWGARTGRPLITFQTAEGKTIQTSTKVGPNGFYKEGQELDIYYIPENPQYTLIKNFTEEWLLISFFGVIGLLLCLVIFFDQGSLEIIKEYLFKFLKK